MAWLRSRMKDWKSDWKIGRFLPALLPCVEANCGNCRCHKAASDGKSLLAIAANRGKFVAAFSRLLPLRFCGPALTSTTVRRWCLPARLLFMRLAMPHSCSSPERIVFRLLVLMVDGARHVTDRIVACRTERTFETGANGARRLGGAGNRERSEHGFKRPLGAPPYRFGQNAALCLAGC
jgi:hypothetical protein